MTPWLNRGAKKTNEPTIPLILQAFGWLNRAALARAAAPAPRPRMIDRSPEPDSKLDVGQPPPAVPEAVASVGSRPAASRARGFGANKVNAPLYC